MFKTETHLHVSEVSPCSELTAEEMMNLYHEAGYKTVFVSDHLMQCYCDSLGDIPWADKMTIFLSGYYKAKKIGEALGMNILMSAELAFVGSPNHYLVYGISKEFLCAYPDLCKMSPDEFYKVAKEHSIFVSEAHPNRDKICFPTPDCVDAFEVCNTNPRHDDYSDENKTLAKEHNLYMTGGSDAHQPCDIARGGIATEQEIKSAEEFIAIIKSGNFEILTV